MSTVKKVDAQAESERHARAVAGAVGYWVLAAREAHRWRVDLRRAARAEVRCRQSGRLFDESRRCRDRRDIFMSIARQVRADRAFA
jgi:hypothetical protein